jgi:[FeFe] hydrogenase (group B1/B3)
MAGLKQLNIFEKMRGLHTDINGIIRESRIEVAKIILNKEESRCVELIPYKLAKKETPTFRDSVFAERAILRERIRLTYGLDCQEFGSDHPVGFDVHEALTDEKILQKPIVNIIKIACERCPTHSYMVSNMCRSCLSHPCSMVCPKDCITITPQGALIDQERCIKCGRCAQVCPYNAIIYRERPCEVACGVKAISSDGNGFANIDYDKCVSCGLCIVSCPFGAIAQKSEIVQVLYALEKSKEGGLPVYAIIAPSFVGQFGDTVTPGKISKALNMLGFADMVEVAYGADIEVLHASKELMELVECKDSPECKDRFVGTSCCPAWVQAARKNFPELKDNISESYTPMVETAKKIKESTPDSRIVFIGPCVSKKVECFDPEVEQFVDYTMTFEELYSVFLAAEIDFDTIEDTTAIQDASMTGRLFPVAGGVGKAVTDQTKALLGRDEDIPMASADTLESCIKMLKDIKRGAMDPKPLMVEGMACPFGCIGGPGTVTTLAKAKRNVNNFAKEAEHKLPSDYLDKDDL